MFRNPETEEIRGLLRSTGTYYKNGIRYFQVRCPYHDDRNPSAVIYKDNGFFKCFTCLTEKPFHRLYKDLTGIEWDGKISLSLSMFRNSNTDAIAERVKAERRMMTTTANQQEFVHFDGRLYDVKDVYEAQRYCDSREISADFIEVFGLKAFISGKVNDIPWNERLIIPLYDEENIMRCVEGRDFTRSQEKKVLYPVNCSVNYIFNSANLDREKTLIVVEGVMDVHKIWQWLTQNVTCSFGILLKEHQKEQLKEFKDIILFIDDDEAGRRSVALFEEFYPYDFRVAICPENDPGSCTREQLESVIENAKPFNVFLMDDLKVFPEKKKLSLTF